MAPRQQKNVLTVAAGSTRRGYMKVTDDLKRGKVITEEYIPIVKQVTKDYQNGKVNTKELMEKKTTTKDYRKGTVTTKNRTTAKSVTEDRGKGIKITEKLETTKTATKGCKTIKKVVTTKQSHHSSKEICPMTMTCLVKGKANLSWSYIGCLSER